MNMKRQYYQEIYLLNDKMGADSWQKLYDAVLSTERAFASFELIFKCSDNLVRFFIVSNRDLSNLSNKIENLLLRPVNKQEVELPEVQSKERFVHFVTGGNLLDLKERFAIQKSQQLEYVVLNVRSISSTMAIVRSSLYFKQPSGHYSKASNLTTRFPTNLLAIDFTTNTHYLKKTMPLYLNIEKSLHMLTSNRTDPLFEVDTFPYLPN